LNSINPVIFVQKESVCVKVSKIDGEKTIILASKLEILNRDLEIQSDEKFVYVPLTGQPSEHVLKTIKQLVAPLEVTSRFFPERRRRKKSVLELLEDRFPPHLLASLPRAVDVVGDIAIVEIPPEHDSNRTLIGEAVLQAYKNVHTVLAKAGPISGTYRLREFDVIAGEAKTETIHKEYGCEYYVDVAKVYFSPRLSYEHKRIASLVKEGETIVDFFAGVGPFAVQIAKTHENVKVYAVDLNPDAVEYLRKNVRLNRVMAKVQPILGDAGQIAKQRLSEVADRVIMNLPERAIEFVDAACSALKPKGGVIHFYKFVKGYGSMREVEREFTMAVEGLGRRVERILFSRFVRETAPHEWQTVLDAEIR
jgi:tRNA (guanine37-N1)-methyltransferase